MTSSFWTNLVERGIPKGKHERRRLANEALAAGVVSSAGVYGRGRKRGAGLPDNEACSDEDDDEDD